MGFLARLRDGTAMRSPYRLQDASVGRRRRPRKAILPRKAIEPGDDNLRTIRWPAKQKVPEGSRPSGTWLTIGLTKNSANRSVGQDLELLQIA